MTDSTKNSPKRSLQFYEDKILKNSDGEPSIAFHDLLNRFQDLQSDYEKLKKGANKKQVVQTDTHLAIGAQNAAIRIQSWWRKELTLIHLKQDVIAMKASLVSTNDKTSPEERVMKEFARQLQNKNLTPEAFYRICDSSYTHSVRIDQFQQTLNKAKVILTQAQLKRLVMILDEDMEGNITLEEYAEALEAYHVSGESHLTSTQRKSFEHRCLFKLVNLLRSKNISFTELFNACDENNQENITTKELTSFIETISSDFKIKELHSLCRFLDINNNTIIEKNDFIRQLKKAEQICLSQPQNMQSSLKSKTPSFGIQAQTLQNNFFEEGSLDLGDQAFFSEIPSQPKQVPSNSQVKQTSQKNATDQKSDLLSRMEFEGPSIQEFLGYLKPMVKGGFLPLGNVQRGLQSFYPSLTLSERTLLTQDSIQDKTKVNFQKLQLFLSKKIDTPSKQIASGLLSPRQSKEEAIAIVLKELNSKNLKAISIYRMADIKNKGVVKSTDLEVAFFKLIPDVDSDIIQIVLKALNINGLADSITKNDFETVFSDGPALSSTLSKSDGFAQSKDKDDLYVLRKLDAALQKQNITAQTAFNKADTGRKGAVTGNALKQSFKMFLSEDDLSFMDMKKVMLAIDTNGNGLIEEQEFITIMQTIRQQNTSSTPSKQAPIKQVVQEQKSDPKQAEIAQFTSFMKILDSKVNLKKTLADVQINENGLVQISKISQIMKTLTLNDGSSLKPSDYFQMIKQLDSKQEGSVSASTLLTFLEQNAPSFQSDFTLDLKYQANLIEFKYNFASTKQYFQQNKLIVQKDITNEKDLYDCFAKPLNINVNISKLIFNQLNSTRKKQVSLDDAFNMVDQYRVKQVESKPAIENAKPIQSSSQQDKAADQKPNQKGGAAETSGLQGIFSEIESKIGATIESALQEYFCDERITTLAVQRKMNSLSNNTVDRSIVAQLCRAFDKSGKGTILIKDVFQTLMENGKNFSQKAITQLAKEVSEPVDQFFQDQDIDSGIEMSSRDYLDLISGFSKIQSYDALCLYYELNKFQDELIAKVLIDKIKEIKKSTSKSIAAPAIPQKQPQKPKESVEEFKEQKITHMTKSVSFGNIKDADLNGQNQDIVKELFAFFISNFDRITTDAILTSALSKISKTLKSLKISEANEKFDPQSQGVISIDILRLKLDELHDLTHEERVVLSILPMKKGSDDFKQIKIVDYLKFLRSLTITPQIVSQNRSILKINLECIKQSLQSQGGLSQSQVIQPVQVHTQVQMQHATEENIMQIHRVLDVLKNAFRKQASKNKLENLFVSSQGQSIYFYVFYQFLDQEVGPIVTTSDEDEAELTNEYLYFEQHVDPQMSSKIHFYDFTKFCEYYKLDFKSQKAVPVEESNDEIDNSKEIGEHLKCGKLRYTIIPSRDYYKGIPTILNSEKAALVVASKIFKSLQEHQHFIDTDFGPKDEKGKDKIGSYNSMYYTDISLLTKKGFVHPDDVSWIRPERLNTPDDDTVEKEFGFVLGGTSSNDVKQGRMGNCWFIGALSVLARRDDLLRGQIDGLNMDADDKDMQANAEIAEAFSNGVYPPLFHIYRHKRLYVLRFFIDFSWRYVIIDDRIPCLTTTDMPVFARCTDIRELWVPLIEKAYAKINGCYEATASGYIDDGLNEMTGLATEKIQLQQIDRRTGQGVFPHKSIGTSDQFWTFLMRLKAQECMMGCSVSGLTEAHIKDEDGRPVGILSGHAYGVVDLIEIKDIDMENPRKTHRLFRIRNPWGTAEWNGKWSDNSEEIQEKYKKQLQDYMLTIKDEDERWELRCDDGTFLINYQSWRDIYNKMYVCLDFPRGWTAIRFSGDWNATCSGGIPTQMTPENKKLWAKNPQYLLTTNRDIELFVSLAQPNGRGKNTDGKYYAYPFSEVHRTINFVVMQLPPSGKVEQLEEKLIKGSSPMIQGKDVSMRLKLPKGQYVIVPATQKAGESGPFYLSFYYDLHMRDAHVKRIDKPELDNFEYILEETDHFDSVKGWKLDLAQKRLVDVIRPKDDIVNENMASFIDNLEQL